MYSKSTVQTKSNSIAHNNTINSNNNKFYVISNFIIYTLIIILLAFISYDIFIIFRNNSTHTPPKNSINVSPNNSDNIHNVFIEN